MRAFRPTLIFIFLVLSQVMIPVVPHGDDEEDDEEDSKTDKDRPAELGRDDFPSTVGRGRPGIGSDYKPKRVHDSGIDPKPLDYGYDSKPTSDREGYLPKPVEDSGGGREYVPKPAVDRPVRVGGGGRYGGGGGGYISKPIDEGYGHRPRPVRPVRVGLGGYNPKPAEDREGYRHGGGGGGYNPKPVLDRDVPKPGGDGGYISVDDEEDYIPRPVGGGGGYYPKPAVDRDVEKPGGGGGYIPEDDEEDYIPRPVGGGGGYYPKPEPGDSNNKPGGVDLGGYDLPNNKPINPDRKDLGGYDNDKDGGYDDGYVGGGKDVDRVTGGRPGAVVDSKCICVPYYQCEDGHIVTDGAGIIDARKRKDPDLELPLDGKLGPDSCGPFHVCCNAPESSTVKPYEHRCGMRNPSGINSRILSPSNKGEADFGEWPWQAAVLKAEGKVNIFMCGGVLIDKYHVLTVAHCVFHLYQLNEYPLKVRLGEWDTQTITEFLAHVDYSVSKIIVHPEFRNTSLWNDVAILRLEEPVLFAPHIGTVCLPKYDETFADQNCVVTGWGKDAYKGGTFSNVMKEVAIQVIDNYKCEEMLRKTRLGRFYQLHEGFLCAGGESGLDSCKGDGGGPLVCYMKDKSYALAGIVSWGIDCGQPGVPGVYIRIQKYLEWITKTTGVQLQSYWPSRS